MFFICRDFNSVACEGRSICPISKRQGIEFGFLADKTCTTDPFDCRSQRLPWVIVCFKCLQSEPCSENCLCGGGYIVYIFDEVVETRDCGELYFTKDRFFEGFRKCLIDSSGCAFLARVSF